MIDIISRGCVSDRQVCGHAKWSLRIRAALTAVLALSAAPGGFTVADLATRVHTNTGNTDYTIRHAAYDLRKLRGKNSSANPAATRCSHHCRPPGTTRPRHRTRPRRHPKPPDWPQTRHLDPHRPRLRNPPHQHANPLPPPRHHHRSRRGIDNFLSIEVPQAPRAECATWSALRPIDSGVGRKTGCPAGCWLGCRTLRRRPVQVRPRAVERSHRA